MAKSVDPLIRIAKELAALSPEDAARAVAISKELRALVPQSIPQLAAGTGRGVTIPAKRKGRKPGSKNKKKELDETFPKITNTDSGAAQ